MFKDRLLLPDRSWQDDSQITVVMMFTVNVLDTAEDLTVIFCERCVTQVNFHEIKVLTYIYIYASMPVYVCFFYIIPSWKAEMSKTKRERE